MAARERIVIVGASLAGVSFLERYRSRGGSGEVILVGAEHSFPYDRPPLSKSTLLSDDWQPSHAWLQDSHWYSSNDVTMYLGQAACKLDPASKVLTLADGECIKGDHVVIATGSRARRIPGFEPQHGVHYLRDLTDGLALRSALRADRGQLVLLGAGFIGLEVAAAARRLGWHVIVLERERNPLSRVLGATAGRLCVEGLRDEGVTISCGSVASQLLGGDTIEGVRLDTDAIVDTNLVIVGAGAQPNVEWLSDSGLTIDNGIVCDASGRTSTSNVWAVGDVARWPNSISGRHDRVEQWQAARDHGHVVADALLEESSPVWATVPYFWSDLSDRKVQAVGVCRTDLEPHVIHAGHRTIMLFGTDRLEGVLTISYPRAAAFARRLLLRQAHMQEAIKWAEKFGTEADMPDEFKSSSRPLAYVAV